ncbi:MAG: hypothetical protein ACK4WH_09310 [Phycisphaerales bacterium]
MASIGYEGERGELKRIMFRDEAGKQKSLRLGRCSERAAQGALAGFERVLEAHRVGSTSTLTACGGWRQSTIACTRA